MGKSKQMKVILVLLGVVVLISFLVANKIIVEGLKNFEDPIEHYNKFHEKIRSQDDEEYGDIVRSGRPGYVEFNDTDKYNDVEVEQDIKYFNNATNLIMGFQMVEKGLSG